MKNLLRVLLVLIPFVSVEAEVDTYAILSAEVKYPVILRKIEETVAGETTDIYELEFCHMGTCDVFQATQMESYKPLTDFFFVYLLYFPSYADWSKRNEHAVAPVGLDNIPNGPLLLEQYREQCNEVSEIENAVCVARYLYDKHSIVEFMVRRDESYVRTRQDKLDAKLTFQGAEDGRQWINRWKESER